MSDFYLKDGTLKRIWEMYFFYLTYACRHNGATPSCKWVCERIGLDVATGWRHIEKLVDMEYLQKDYSTSVVSINWTTALPHPPTYKFPLDE